MDPHPNYSHASHLIGDPTNQTVTDHLVGQARRLFRAIRLVRLDEPLLDRAGDLGPAESRWLDARRGPVDRSRARGVRQL
jgi:hypothetical protein